MVWGPSNQVIPRETFSIKKALMELLMGTQEEMVVSAICGVEPVGYSSLGIQLFDVRCLTGWFLEIFFPCSILVDSNSLTETNEIGTAFLGIKFIQNGIYSNLMMSLLTTYSQWTPCLPLCIVILWASQGCEAASIFETRVIARSSDRMSDSSAVFSTVLRDKD